jgi:hypothetical protein
MTQDLFAWLTDRWATAMEANDDTRAEQIVSAALSHGGWRDALEQQLLKEGGRIAATTTQRGER